MSSHIDLIVLLKAYHASSEQWTICQLKYQQNTSEQASVRRCQLTFSIIFYEETREHSHIKGRYSDLFFDILLHFSLFLYSLVGNVPLVNFTT